MKLKNKKTGGVFDVAFHSSYKEGKITIGVEEEADPVFPKCNFGSYDSLKEFCESWEDAPEPLIKNEKVRKAIRAWADAARIDMAYLYIDNEKPSTFCVYKLAADCHYIQIAFHDKNPIKDGRAYTIAELCGEDEE